jgi:hypothetical protein
MLIGGVGGHMMVVVVVVVMIGGSCDKWSSLAASAFFLGFLPCLFLVSLSFVESVFFSFLIVRYHSLGHGFFSSVWRRLIVSSLSCWSLVSIHVC